MITIGIDPGLSGALARLVDGELAGLEDMPVMQRSTKQRQIDPVALAKLLHEWTEDARPQHQVIVIIEQVMAMPTQGVASTLLIGISGGICEGVTAGLGLPYELIYPATWKKNQGIALDRPGQGETKQQRLRLSKELARSKAIQAFPLADLHRKMDHNKAEALLLARYGHWKHNGSTDPLAPSRD